MDNIIPKTKGTLKNISNKIQSSINVSPKSIKMPSIKTPSIKTPSIKTPSIKTPSIKMPSIKMPSIINSNRDKNLNVSNSQNSVNTVNSVNNNTDINKDANNSNNLLQDVEVNNIGSNISYFFINNIFSIIFWIGLIILIVFLGINGEEFFNNLIDLINTIKSHLNILINNKNKSTNTKKETKKESKLQSDEKLEPEEKIDSEETLDSDETLDSEETLQDNYNVENTTSTNNLEESIAYLENKLNLINTPGENINKQQEILPIESTGKFSNDFGYCFIGEYKGHRTCSKTYPHSKCMSGDIFSSLELCMNPTMRE